MDRDDLAMIGDTLDRLLSDGGESGDPLWDDLTANGFADLCVAEDRGGAGAHPADIVHLARICGKHALALPLAETAMANGVLTAAGHEPAEQMTCIVIDGHDEPATHAAQVSQVLLALEGGYILLRPDRTAVTPLEGGEDGYGWLDTASMAQIHAGDWAGGFDLETLHLAKVAIRAGQMAGAMESVLALTLDHTATREQFGRPLAKFQAIQHHLSTIASETAAASAACDLAADAIRSASGMPRLLDVASGKLRCGQAAARVAAAAHQAHGAIGFTREYALGRFTRRLWQWQDECGTEAAWAERIGTALLGDENPSVWRYVSS